MFVNVVNVKPVDLLSSCASYIRSAFWVQVRSRFRGIQAGFDMFKHTDLYTRWTVKGSKGTVVNRALPSLHGVTLENKRTVHWKIKFRLSPLVYWMCKCVYKCVYQYMNTGEYRFMVNIDLSTYCANYLGTRRNFS